MDKQKVINIIKTERECVKRNDMKINCDRHCENCDLLLETKDIIEAYDYVLKILK